MAALVRARTGMRDGTNEFQEWSKLAGGIVNNNPALWREWLGTTSNQRRHSLRTTFGRDLGDSLRREGWGVLKFGPLTADLIRRFTLRLGQALFYKHVGRIFHGTVYSQHFNMLNEDNPDRLIQALLAIAPDFALVERSGKSLETQFAYKFNFSVNPGIFYGAMHFSEQFVFYVLAAEKDFALKIEQDETIPVGFGFRSTVE